MEVIKALEQKVDPSQMPQATWCASVLQPRPPGSIKCSFFTIAVVVVVMLVVVAAVAELPLFLSLYTVVFLLCLNAYCRVNFGSAELWQSFSSVVMHDCRKLWTTFVFRKSMR